MISTVEGKQKLKKYGVLTLIILIAVIILTSIINAIYCNNLKNELIGKKYYGNLDKGRFYASLSGDYCNIGVTVINKNELTYYYEENNEENILGPEYTIRKTYENIPYKIKNGFFNIAIIIDKKDVEYYNPVEPFIFNGDGKLYTSNYNSRMDMYLFEK